MKKLIFIVMLIILMTMEVFSQGQIKIDSLQTVLKTAKEDTSKVMALFYYALEIQSLSRDSFIYYLRQSLLLSKKTDFKKATVLIYRNISNYHDFYGSKDSAMFYALISLKFARELKDSLNISESFFLLSRRESRKFENNVELGETKGLIYLDSTISYANNDKVILIKAFLRKAEIYGHQKKINEAKYFLQKAFNLSPAGKQELSILMTQANLLRQFGQADSALIIYNSLFEKFKTETFFDDRFKSYNYSQIAAAYLSLKNYKLAITNGETGLNLALDKNLTKEKLNNLNTLYQIYYKIKDYKKALYYFKWHRDYSDTLNYNSFRSSETYFENLVKEERNQNQIKLLEHESEKQKLQRNSLVGGLAVVLLFAGVFFTQRNKINKEKKRSDELLLNILPEEVAEELKEKGSADAKQFDEVTVMFTDFKGFTQIAEKLSPAELVAEIHSCFNAFDNIITKHNIEKIKTIGDSYMCAGGLPVPNKTNATDVVSAAIEIQQFMEQHLQQRKNEDKEPFEIRIGVHTGSVVAGIVGVKKFAYDIWGDTVNIASRMESSGEAGKVNISGSTHELVKDKFKCEHRGKIQAKNKGVIDMYFVKT